MIGRTIQNRYEIVKKIGEGGMAVVYKANDLKLGRLVALKVLKDEFSKDKNFIIRFKNEARAYAALSHPNIINVFDIAEDDGIIFLVFEYIDAENLKDYIASKGVLEFNETLKIMRDICNAISYAHEKGIIHRDIKPSNILIDREGEIKVTDFGIARTTQTETVTQGSMLGSVYYFSPEQAQGKEITPASDVYSLGILAYQLLTGKLPFEGDNAVAVALKHVKDNPENPSLLNNKLNTDIDNCILKTLRKNPLERYQTVNDFYNNLNKALGKLLTISLEHTTIRPLIKVANEDSASAKYEIAPKRTKHKKTNYTGWIILLILLCAAAYFFINSLGQKIDVPNITNMTLEDAVKTASMLDLNIKVSSEEFSDNVEAGKIIKQNPAFGKKLRIKGVIWVIISKGREGFVVPNVMGQKLEDAQKLLASMDLVCKIEKEEINKNSEDTVIISQRPAPGTSAIPKTIVYLQISRGASSKTAPNLIDLKLEEAEKILKDLSIEYEIAGEKPSAKIPKGNVIDQEPKPKRVIPDNKIIKLYISSGFDNLTAPNLIGLGISEAKQEINELGLDMIIIGDAGADENSQIVSQIPEVGSAMKNNIIKVKIASTMVVPDLVGKTKEEAELLIKEANFILGKVEYLKSSVSKSGTVIEQDPKAGLEVPAGQKIDLIIVK